MLLRVGDPERFQEELEGEHRHRFPDHPHPPESVGFGKWSNFPPREAPLGQEGVVSEEQEDSKIKGA